MAEANENSEDMDLFKITWCDLDELTATKGSALTREEATFSLYECVESDEVATLAVRLFGKLDDEGREALGLLLTALRKEMKDLAKEAIAEAVRRATRTDEDY